MGAETYTLITGASSGIGRETAIRLSATSRLILHGRDAARLDETRQQCTTPEQHVPWLLDFNDVTRIEDSLKELVSRHGLAVENVVHCSGTLKILPLRALEFATVREMM